MSQKFTLEVPQELSAIPLKQYQKYLKVMEGNEDAEDKEFMNLKVLEIFCGVTMKEAYKLPLAEFSFIISHIISIFKEDTPLQRDFTMTDPQGNSVKFGFIPKLDDITLGEFVDLDNYIGDWQQIHKAMAVLYRPITFQKGDLYLIEDYEGSDKYAEVMEDAPVNVALGAVVFFLSFRERFIGLFTELFAGGFDEESGSNGAFGKKWGWYQSIYAIAKGDITKFKEIAKLSASECLTWLEFEKEKNDLEAKMIKQKMK